MPTKRPGRGDTSTNETPAYTDASVADVREGGQVYGGGPVMGQETPDLDVGNRARGQERTEGGAIGIGATGGESVGGAGGEPTGGYPGYEGDVGGVQGREFGVGGKARSERDERGAPGGGGLGIDALDRSLQQTRTWIREIALQMGATDRRDGYRALRAVLPALRDYLPTNEAAHLAAQLPVVLRGLFFEGWRPGAVTPRAHTREDFLRDVERHLGGVPLDPQKACHAVFTVMRRNVTDGEWADVEGALPDVLKGFLERERA